MTALGLSGGGPSAGGDAERPAETPASAAAQSRHEPRAKIPLRLQADAAQRELAMRHRVYPGLVKRGKMTESEAAAEIETMRAIRDTLRLFAEHEDQVRAALARAIEARRLADELDELRSHPAVTAVMDEFPGSAIAGLTTPPEPEDET